MLQTDIETALAPTPEPAGPDWDMIRADFEAGALSVREIARRAGISHTGILKRANAEGWKPGFQPPVETKLETAVETKPPLTEAAVDRIIEAIKADKTADDDEFNWDVDNHDVLLWDRPAIAVYLNRMSQIVIREESRNGDDDAYIRIDRRDVPVLVQRLQELAR
jgi:hypothetical protein